ncbi:MDR family oxidoreductase [Thiohalorhabdus sp. Cl-TMA]|uniref:MDR family oxidoreductase n=1 Tax=Thiohalorhabdus methylotrophus TaxID=3242694 RepID=A0ABV4TVJ9_9GAMM
MFKALLLDAPESEPRVQSLKEADLPAGDVTVAVEYSGLNYKDGLVLTGRGGLVKHYPHVPGIDLAGTVAESAHPGFSPGDGVLLTGWGVGERHWGGYAEKARVRGDWLTPLPAGLDSRRAMAAGTAGLAAMLGVLALEEHGVTPGDGPVLVTGATGGVGSLAVALLARAGHRVAAVTGRPEHRDYLLALGAGEVLDRAELAGPPERPLEHQRWAGCIDAVGGDTLARVLGQIRYGGSVAAVGLAGGADLPASVVPFLLRGVNLLGIDTVYCPPERRSTAWQRLVRDLPRETLDGMVREAGLEELKTLGPEILRGGVRGRVVVTPGA